jgi:hypothetical protein
MGLKLNATNGGGSVELDVPDTVNSDLALTVPAAAGTIDRLERAGNILQVVSSQTQLTAGSSTTNTSYVNSGQSLSITPIGENSHFYVSFTGYVPHVHSNNGNFGVAIKIFRNVDGAGWTACTTGFLEGYYNVNSASQEWHDFGGHCEVFDEPTYTLGDTIDYRTQFRAADTNTTLAFYHHIGGIDAQSENPTHQIVIMEVSA